MSAYPDISGPTGNLIKDKSKPTILPDTNLRSEMQTPYDPKPNRGGVSNKNMSKMDPMDIGDGEFEEMDQ